MKLILILRRYINQLPKVKLLMILIMVMGIIPAACSQVPINGEVMDNVEEIESEYYSNYSEEGEITKKISSKEVFEIEWEMVHSGMDPVPELPEINFDERDIILLMMDTKPTGGYGIDHFKVHASDDQIAIQYAERHPGENCFTTQALTRPYKFISIPKSDKEVKFLKGETVINDCNE